MLVLTLLLIRLMRRSKLVIILVGVLFLCSLSSCFSLLKADRMVYAGTIGKKVDAALIDSIQKVEINSDK